MASFRKVWADDGSLFRRQTMAAASSCRVSASIRLRTWFCWSTIACVIGDEITSGHSVSEGAARPLVWRMTSLMRRLAKGSRSLLFCVLQPANANVAKGGSDRGRAFPLMRVRSAWLSGTSNTAELAVIENVRAGDHIVVPLGGTRQV